MMTLKSDLKHIKKLEHTDNIGISHLPQLYRCSLEFAKQQCNDQLNKLLDQIPAHPEYKHVSIDSRSHMLMKGMYPCIPGWHCDDFYRTAEYNDQPDLDNVDAEAPALHYLIVLGDCSRTEFVKHDVAFFKSLKEIYTQIGADPLYKYIDEELDKDKFESILVEPNHLYTFGPTALHKGSAATHNGWRCFIRVTFSNHREPKNELRYQTQVYTDGRVSW